MDMAFNLHESESVLQTYCLKFLYWIMFDYVAITSDLIEWFYFVYNLELSVSA
jgi:hypothetical protein